MPITYLDMGLLAVMLISGVLAMVRGFLREVFSIASWVLAALAAVYGYQRVLPYVKQYVNNDLIATGIAAGGIFLITLLIVSLITVKISDMVLDSRIGALDRTLGFIFGLARGLIVMVVAFIFFLWLVPEKSLPSWAAEARSFHILKNTGDWLISVLPDDIEARVRSILNRRGTSDDATPPDANPQTPPVPGRTQLPPDNLVTQTKEPTYKKNDRQVFNQLLESTGQSQQ
ncbi:MAG: CvpA family protein [Xanthobacteraceae bacterium]|nr:CvpA family protein [Xanthobacteraceae bacterium]QYK45977.1 MAG: CvpA family protein [Xanthobacteraceae bacterium]